MRWNWIGTKMSYCRFSDADAYIFQSTRGLECCGCFHAPRTKLEVPYVDFLGLEHEYDYEPVWFLTAQEMLDHIAFHREQGDDIPLDVDERLKRDFPDLNASTAETEEERLEREEQNRPAHERMVAKLREAAKENGLI